MSVPVRIAKLSSQQPDFQAVLARLLRFDAAQDEAISATVKQVIADIRARGDQALLELTQKFDQLSVGSVSDLEITPQELRQAFDRLPEAQRRALSEAAQRIREFHELQRQSSWTYTDGIGNRLGQRVSALDRAGLYVPGGKAAYPSSVLMNAIPAKVAGVSEVIMVVPTPGGVRNPLVLAAAFLGGVDRVFTIGGAQAVAALAYGTSTIPAVDKIVG
ncbi:MAG: histidinol dehydrogenase, partial [Burkholderiaceae bacterium]